jgi:ABC-type uncharacterized transport system substrate-binding protein
MRNAQGDARNAAPVAKQLHVRNSGYMIAIATILELF